MLHSLLWLIHCSRSGWCSPSYETISDKAHCARSTVAVAIQALEQAGLLSWINRIVKVRTREVDLFGKTVWCWRTLRTSNAYTFTDPRPKPVQTTIAAKAVQTIRNDSKTGPMYCHPRRRRWR